MCAAAAVQIHALALFFAGCSLFAICHFLAICWSAWGQVPLGGWNSWGLDLERDGFQKYLNYSFFKRNTMVFKKIRNIILSTKNIVSLLFLKKH